MKSTETSPLLPKAPRSPQTRESPPRSAQYTQQRPASASLRRRASKSSSSQRKTVLTTDDDESSNSDFEGEEDEYDASDATRAALGGATLHQHHNRTRRAPHALQQPPVLSYSSDSSLALGLGSRKPRWPGFRSKAASLAVAMDVRLTDAPPRKKTRRNRFRELQNEENAAVAVRRGPPIASSVDAMARVAAYCTCEAIGVFKLLKWLDKAVKDPRLHFVGWRHKMYMGVVHASFDPSEGRPLPDIQEDDEHAERAAKLRRKDAFYFATGSCVFWGMTREEEMSHIQALVAFSTGRVDEIEAEDMEFTYGDASRVANDAIVLSTSKVEEKLAISFAMSQSAKLDVFEERVEQRIRNTKHIPSNLALTGSIQYSQTDISRLIGQLFIELADVNLHSDILDEPDYLWEDDEYEPLYTKMLKYLDVNNRVKILNKRLDILRELVEVLNQELTQQHGTKLEWIIIWLLVVEVVISIGWNIIVKDLLGFFNRPK